MYVYVYERRFKNKSEQIRHMKYLSSNLSWLFTYIVVFFVKYLNVKLILFGGDNKVKSITQLS